MPARSRPSPPADPTAALPDDPVILRQMILEQLDALRDTRRQNDELQHRLDLLLRRIHGPRTESFAPNQPLLIPGTFEPMAPEISEPGSAILPKPGPELDSKKPSRPHGRRAMPKNLPRVPRVYEVMEAERHCPECGECRIQIGAERTSNSIISR